MEVDLTDFFDSAGVLRWATGAELAIAKSLAAAANIFDETAPKQTAIALNFIVVKETHAREVRHWTRAAKDAVLRCVDRAATRVYPPLDSLQYHGATLPSFSDGDGGLRLALAVLPTSATVAAASMRRPHVVEGMQISTPALCKAMDEKEEGSAAPTDVDADLWNRVYAKSASGVRCWATEEVGEQSKLGRLRWRVACWLVEVLLNEGSWARIDVGPSTSGPQRGRSASSSQPGGADTRRGRATVRRLFTASATSSAVRPRYAHVIEAAMDPLARGDLREVGPPSVSGPSRLIHVDTRGMEWDGLLVGYTSSYAYIALPSYSAASFISTRQTSCSWSCVARIPIPSVLDNAKDALSVRLCEAPQTASSARGKRKREGYASEGMVAATACSSDDGFSVSRLLEVLSNVEEMMLFDTAAKESFQVPAAPYRVTLRTHRVYCRSTATSMEAAGKMRGAAPSPAVLSMSFEDAYAMAIQEIELGAYLPHWSTLLIQGLPSSPSSPQVAATLLLRDAVHSFADVAGVVRESCRRFLETSQRFQETFHALRTASCPVAAEAAGGKPAEDETSEVPEAGERAATENSSAAPSEQTAPLPGRCLNTDAVASLAATESSESLIFAKASALYAGMTDTMSVHYKKLRGAGKKSTVTTIADVRSLEESNTVEFKAMLSTYAGGDRAEREGRRTLMNIERIRHTMAAMAGSQGGHIIIGVTDDGRVVGHSRGLSVIKQLRTSGFCPAMVKDAVHLRELRVLQTNQPARASAAEDDALEKRKAMPENWWKTPAPLLTSNTNGTDKPPSTPSKAAAGEERVLTVIRVEKGQAPFYAASRHGQPYARGCASTTPMPVLVMARRLLRELH